MATGATCARPIITIIPICVTAITTVAAIRRIATRGVQRTAADEVERVVRCQLNARTGTSGALGIGSRAGDGYALGQVEIHRALDGQAAAASRAVGERDIPRDVIVRRSACHAKRLSRSGTFIIINGSPVVVSRPSHGIDLIPTGLRPRSLHDGTKQGED